KYCLPKFAQEVFDKAGEPKEIMWVDAPNHIDLYDVEKYVEPAVNKTAEWFNKYLIGKSGLRKELTA
ncbi:MAG TPA: alpha/beta hydrolase, partial [Nitrososphaera sp.]|nr:alpha/beta hydrolase [Nitrososphaera sp.]